MFDHLSGNKNESNMDDTYPSSLVETPETTEKERCVSKRRRNTNTFLINKRKWNYNL